MTDNAHDQARGGIEQRILHSFLILCLILSGVAAQIALH
jgi:hypothetical protein